MAEALLNPHYTIAILFYKTYPQIFQTLFGKSQRLLSWSHYLVLLQVHDETARDWYEQEALSQTWNVRTLQRNVSSQYYYRLLSSQNKSAVKSEMKQKTPNYQLDKLEFNKNPIIAEYLGFSANSEFTETELETSILSNLQKFLMELGKGYAFVARQQHIHTEKEDYYIDLVFYNYILKCFVLIDLKTSKITHQDVGQMDMYIRMYDELKKGNDDNPTIGIVLCSDTDSDIAKYSILHGNEQLFASKYKLYLPSEEELRKEIETQKENIILSVVVKVGKGELTVSVSHDKARNGSGKTAKMRTDVVLNGLLFIFLLLGFHTFNHFFGLVLDSLFNLFLHCLCKFLQRVGDRRLIGLLGLPDFFLRLRL